VTVGNVDLKKLLRDAYSAKVGEPELVEIGPRPFLMIDGHGDPNLVLEYVDAVEALYPIAYAIRACIKKETGDAYTVMPLEGLWWTDDMKLFSMDRKGDWNWTMMISLPDVVSVEIAEAVIAETTRAKQLAAGEKVRFEMFDEDRCAQVMHLGPYAAEAPTIELLHRFIEEQGLSRRGRHHEIYVGDPRRSDPSKLRTIIRQPVQG
jgi:hypothetical protein